MPSLNTFPGAIISGLLKKKWRRLIKLAEEYVAQGEGLSTPQQFIFTLVEGGWWLKGGGFRRHNNLYLSLRHDPVPST
jgi:hypothetical protein